MSIARSIAIVIGFILGGQMPAAQDLQDLSRYRGYVLGASLDSVIAASGARADEVKTLHERPARIQELEWRAPYPGSGNTLPDPVREISFTFLDSALYQVNVKYDPDRTIGLTNNDIIGSISGVYGAPAPASGRTRSSLPPEAFPDSVVLARWENAESLLTLFRAQYSPEFQLILTSKPSSTRARRATREAARLDVLEAPRREADQRRKEAADGIAARDKTRTSNKAAFRP